MLIPVGSYRLPVDGKEILDAITCGKKVPDGDNTVPMSGNVVPAGDNIVPSNDINTTVGDNVTTHRDFLIMPEIILSQTAITT
jgi:hypothetical protein